MIRLGGTIEGVLARLKENTFELVEGKVIQWTNGASIEQQLHAFESAGESLFNMIANFSNAKKEGLVQLIAANGKNAQTVLQVLANEEVQRITAVATSPSASRTIIDFLTGKSSFMQRFSGGSSAFAFNRVNFGSATLTWTASKASAKIKIAHGLGTTPTFVDAKVVAPFAPFTAGTMLEANVIAVSSTEIELAGTCSEALSVTFTVYWFAAAG